MQQKKEDGKQKVNTTKMEDIKRKNAGKKITKGK